jgi:hypothetical protein
MKMLAEYLEYATKFERMATAEKNPKLKADFERQAAAYRKLAIERAKKHGYPLPPELEPQSN